jgi:hypothetical protein
MVEDTRWEALEEELNEGELQSSLTYLIRKEPMTSTCGDPEVLS